MTKDIEADTVEEVIEEINEDEMDNFVKRYKDKVRYRTMVKKQGRNLEGHNIVEKHPTAKALETMKRRVKNLKRLEERLAKRIQIQQDEIEKLKSAYMEFNFDNEELLEYERDKTRNKLISTFRPISKSEIYGLWTSAITNIVVIGGVICFVFIW